MSKEVQGSVVQLLPGITRPLILLCLDETTRSSIKPKDPKGSDNTPQQMALLERAEPP